MVIFVCLSVGTRLSVDGAFTESFVEKYTYGMLLRAMVRAYTELCLKRVEIKKYVFLLRADARLCDSIAQMNFRTFCIVCGPHFELYQ